MFYVGQLFAVTMATNQDNNPAPPTYASAVSAEYLPSSPQQHGYTAVSSADDEVNENLSNYNVELTQASDHCLDYAVANAATGGVPPTPPPPPPPPYDIAKAQQPPPAYPMQQQPFKPYPDYPPPGYQPSIPGPLPYPSPQGMQPLRLQPVVSYTRAPAGGTTTTIITTQPAALTGFRIDDNRSPPPPAEGVICLSFAVMLCCCCPLGLAALILAGTRYCEHVHLHVHIAQR